MPLMCLLNKNKASRIIAVPMVKCCAKVARRSSLLDRGVEGAGRLTLKVLYIRRIGPFLGFMILTFNSL